MVILPVSSTKVGIKEDETKQESYFPIQEIDECDNLLVINTILF